MENGRLLGRFLRLNLQVRFSDGKCWIFRIVLEVILLGFSEPFR